MVVVVCCGKRYSRSVLARSLSHFVLTVLASFLTAPGQSGVVHSCQGSRPRCPAIPHLPVATAARRLRSPAASRTSMRAVVLASRAVVPTVAHSASSLELAAAPTAAGTPRVVAVVLAPRAAHGRCSKRPARAAATSPMCHSSQVATSRSTAPTALRSVGVRPATAAAELVGGPATSPLEHSVAGAGRPPVPLTRSIHRCTGAAV